MRKFLHRLRVKGFHEMAASIKQRILPTPCEAFNAADWMGKRILEIGNWTPVTFNKRGAFPIYPVIRDYNGKIDFAIKSDLTPWNKCMFKQCEPPCKIGKTIVSCATDLALINNNEYDAVISCHVLEHIANPIKALIAWERVVKPAGKVVVIVPRRTLCNDHKRPQTTFEHILKDYDTDVKEDDKSHIEEFLRLYDFDMFTGSNRPTDQSIVDMALRNGETGIIHQHTWDMALTVLAMDKAGLTIEKFCYHPPFHIVVVGTKI